MLATAYPWGSAICKFNTMASDHKKCTLALKKGSNGSRVAHVWRLNHNDTTYGQESKKAKRAVLCGWERWHYSLPYLSE